MYAADTNALCSWSLIGVAVPSCFHGKKEELLDYLSKSFDESLRMMFDQKFALRK